MHKRILLCLMFAVVVLAMPIRAANLPDLTPKIHAIISVKSPMELLRKLDLYISATTKGTSNALPPGFLVVMTQMAIPFPLDTWESDGEAEVIFFQGSTPQDIKVVGIIGVPDFDIFIESLEARGWSANDFETSDANAKSLIMPDGEALVLVDLGNGRVAIGQDAESARRALDGLAFGRESDADIVAHVNVDYNRALLMDILQKEVEWGEEGFAKDIAAAGFKPEFAKNLVTTIRRLFPTFMNELLSINDFATEITFEGEMLLVNWLVRPGAGTMVAETAANVSEKPNVDLTIADSLPDKALFVAASAAISEIVPDAGVRLIELADIYGGIVPEFRQRGVDLATEYLQSEPGPAAVGNYIRGGRQYSVTINKVKEPEKAVLQFAKSVEAMNDIWAAAIEDSGLGLKLDGGLRDTGEVVFYSYRPVFADIGRFQKLLDDQKQHTNNDMIAPNLAALEKMRIFWTWHEDAVVCATGELVEEEFFSILDEIKNGSNESLSSTKSAKQALTVFPNAQILAGVFDISGFFEMYTAYEIDKAVGTHGERVAQLLAGAVQDFADRRKTNHAVIGLAIGAQAGWLTACSNYPAETINQIIRDVEDFQRLQKQVLAVPTSDQNP